MVAPNPFEFEDRRKLSLAPAPADATRGDLDNGTGVFSDGPFAGKGEAKAIRGIELPPVELRFAEAGTETQNLGTVATLKGNKLADDAKPAEAAAAGLGISNPYSTAGKVNINTSPGFANIQQNTLKEINHDWQFQEKYLVRDGIFTTSDNGMQSKAFDLQTYEYPGGGVMAGPALGADNNSLLPKTERLYASVDELLTATDPASKGSPADTRSAASKEPSTEHLDRLKSFLTAESRAPELNLFGRPRVTLWPVRSENEATDPNAPTSLATDSPAGGQIKQLTDQDKLAYQAEKSKKMDSSDKMVVADGDFDPAFVVKIASSGPI